ncbi:MAG: hypothetical protein H8D56_26180 [Planctomycetes bacterium]|nr:hypothetical protein [Planctomycetota bacterium]MBL7146434.1 hypothetical protein [Phycisphaerae bacterium]
MLKSKYVRSTFVTGLLVMLVLATGLQAASVVQPADDPLLKMLPAESLFCIRVNHFEHTVNQTDQFLAGISPIPLGLSMMVRMQLANVLGSPELNGVNMNGSLAVFGVMLPGEQTSNNPASNIFIGGFVPVTDYRQFISNPNCSQPDDNGISKITSNGTPILLTTKIGNHALIGWANDYDKLLRMAKVISTARTTKLASSIDAAEAKLAILEPVWAYGNIQQASKTFGPLLLGKIEEIKTIIKSTGPDSPGAPPKNMQNFTQNVMNMYADILQKLMKEARYFSIAIKPKPNVLNITKTVSAVHGTDMANMFVSDASADRKNNLLNYLEDGAMMNFGVTVNKYLWKECNLKGIDLLAIMAGESMNAEDIDKMKALIEDGIDCLGGPIACSASIDAKNKPPFIAKYVIAVKDKNKFNQLIENSMQLFNTSGILDFYKNMGIETSFEIQRGVDSYKNVSIDSAKLTMKSIDAASPQGQMINSMYGGGFDYRWGIVNGLCVLTIGSNADSSIRELIDQVKAGRTQMGSEVKAALELLPEAEKADFVVTYNVLRWLKIAGSITVMPIPMPMLQTDIPTKSNIALAGKAGNGKMVVDIALPKEHLKEMMTAVLMMQQQMKMMMQQNSNPSGNKMN